MQLPPHEEIVMVSGHAPVRAQKLRYFEDRNFAPRVLPAPALSPEHYADRPATRPDDWSKLSVPGPASSAVSTTATLGADEGGLHRHPEIGEPAERGRFADDLDLLDESGRVDDFKSVREARELRRIARLASLDPNDGIAL
jgi:type IV secretion system protein VirD4